jgi:hypothetical protein
MGRVVNREHLGKLINILIAVTSLQSVPAVLAKISMLYAKLVKLLLKGYSLVKSTEERQNTIEEQAMIKEMVESCEDGFDPVIPICFAFTFEDFLEVER